MSMFGGSTNPTGASFPGYQPSFVHPSSYVPSGVGSQSYWQPSSYPGNTNNTWLKVSEMVTGDKSGVTSQSQTSQQINNLSDILSPIDPKTGKPFSTETSKRGFWGRLSDAVRGKTTTAPTDAETQQRFDNSATTVGQAKRLAMDAVRDYQRKCSRLRIELQTDKANRVHDAQSAAVQWSAIRFYARWLDPDGPDEFR